jgi:hypothetical protein
MRLAPDGDSPAQIGIRQRRQRRKQTAPALFPHLYQSLPRRRGTHEFLVSIALRILSVGGEKIGPARSHIAGQMPGDLRHRIHLPIQHRAKLFVRSLRHRAFRQLLVVPEQRQRVFDIGYSKF